MESKQGNDADLYDTWTSMPSKPHIPLPAELPYLLDVIRVGVVHGGRLRVPFLGFGRGAGHVGIVQLVTVVKREEEVDCGWSKVRWPGRLDLGSYRLGLDPELAHRLPRHTARQLVFDLFKRHSTRSASIARFPQPLLDASHC
jgi:hypothetical protein